MNIGKLHEMLQGPGRWRTFLIILVLIVISGTVLSVIARITFIKDDAETRPRLAVVASPQNPDGVAVRQGATLFVQHVNGRGGVNGRQLDLVTFDETPDAATKIAADKRVIGVVGYLEAGALQAAAPVLAQAKMPVVTPLHLAKPVPGVTSMGLDPGEEARFVANYARNIQLQRIMHVVRESDPRFDPLVEPFVEVYKRFETPVQKVYTIPTGKDSDADLKGLLEELRDLDVGAIYIAARPELAARLVKGIRSGGNVLELFGPSQMATAMFTETMRKLAGKEAATQIHGIIAATPVLFDTANDEAQRFQTRYQQSFKNTPDWLATFAYDAAELAVSGKSGIDTVKGITGELVFIDQQAQLPIQMGVYNGDRLISAPVQFLPIAKGANFNYIDALRQGRVLYVNNRFMFKTNVVYVGFTVNEISEVDRQKEIATVDLSIWFRYRGKFDPQDLQVLNAIDAVKFDTPEESKDSEEVQYRRYRIKQKFKLNFTPEKRAYDNHVAGLTFRHRLLNRNNLMYVVDVLGMPTGSAMLDDLQRRRVVKAGSGWEVENAWVSQDVVRERGDGAPQYVGMTGEQPLFSTITMGTLLKPEAIAARDIIAGEYFIYIAIFGVLGVMMANWLDVRKLSRYWAFQSWLLRVIFQPMILLSVGNLIIDWSYLRYTPGTTQTIVFVYESLWWLLGARLTDIALRRFVWAPLEQRASRKIPDVMKGLATALIFALAVAGITAVVLNQALTSLLATSGVLAMVVGLAVQANIANVFSGIILNVERPFQVGDYIKINNIIGQVKDITWRTIRLESNEGPMLSLANSKASEAFVENYSEVPNGIVATTQFYMPAEADPDPVLAIVTEALANAKSVLFKGDPVLGPTARFKGVVNVNGRWVSCVEAGYRVKILPKKSMAKEELWKHVRQKFLEQGIPLVPADDADIVVPPAK